MVAGAATVIRTVQIIVTEVVPTRTKFVKTIGL